MIVIFFQKEKNFRLQNGRFFKIRIDNAKTLGFSRKPCEHLTVFLQKQ